MDLMTASAGIDASGRCIVRGHRLARVKFVALPVEPAPARARAIPAFLLRVIGRLVAARP
jgi:hypothetical protein